MPTISRKTPISGTLAKPNPRRGKLAFWAGFATFFALIYLGLNVAPGMGMMVLLAVDLPMLGLILVLIRRTRKFGFGLLAASVIFFGTALATCGRLLELK